MAQQTVDLFDRKCVKLKINFFSKSFLFSVPIVCLLKGSQILLGLGDNFYSSVLLFLFREDLCRGKVI